ncbi:DUF4442 domain-containing protein [Tamlana sp. 2_MG-2023]|uniref:DUF4442 domain-containing protein n=1 Tax=unclassified Tamlana TaxID=2614803 RepID=UPI0026E31AEB|nr:MULTISPECIES: DUF4442 domain-containing protein [unclassified Tamlana]MDO6760350.1 DUF4442 domain-containing protein [Tamlana sp. 2_MG-2023]MDO6789952.1 DUF4442 domain-containing protein [Tamlana sp. 1_MG-2023]
MNITPSKLNSYIVFKLPSAYLCGVRTRYIDSKKCVVTVKHRWINQNPFKSMFWAVQGMAAEFSTGALMMMKVQDTGKKISMLVTANNATYTKKATGKITFTCNDGLLVDELLKKAIASGAGETLSMQSIGVDEAGDVVSTFNFEWSVKLKL